MEICQRIQKFHSLTLINLASILAGSPFTRVGEKAFGFMANMYTYVVRAEGCWCPPNLGNAYSISDVKVSFETGTQGNELSIFAGQYSRLFAGERYHHLERLQRDLSRLVRPTEVSIGY